MTAPTPDRIMQSITGGWVLAILGTAVRHGVPALLENGPRTAAAVAEKAGISVRGAQALLDGLTGVGLLACADGRYANTPESSTFLVAGKPTYLGGMADLFLDDTSNWQKLPDAVKSGMPVAKDTADVPDNAFWHKLVPAIATLAFPVAQLAAQRLDIAKRDAVAVLDIGGGSGVWSAVWLGANTSARAVQLDWPQVNAIAHGFVAGFGVADRFRTVDGDFHTADLGRGEYDFVIYSNIAHQESPAENIAVFKKVRAALKPGGTFIISDFVLNGGRQGHPFAMMFSAQMILMSKAGAAFTEPDYRAWLQEAGFAAVTFTPTPGPSTLVFAA